ncbi:hypothetical protein BCR44DRAFT_63250 [Catenaria anguillulae PL171]|uniref:AMP-dependent synthetase/ligase domain-containing protein n=1 Tax=Catenaria anguillulae PL171 TaxID=765915 RepID=A0A1Y2HT36_9FUNG|nr:hypothetical protein BCR44DRAFT_63250 [Catenaria anguillulae PL171]
MVATTAIAAKAMLKPGASVDPNLLVMIPSESESETPTVRAKAAEHGLLSRPASKVDGFEINTVADLFPYAKLHHPHTLAMGKRRMHKVHKEMKEVTKIVDGQQVVQKREWTYYEMGPYSWMTTEEVLDAVNRVGAGLVHLGVKGGQDKVTIFAETSREWKIFAHGCWSQNITITTAYATLGAAAVLHSVNEAEVVSLFTNASTVPVILSQVVPGAHTLRHIIYEGDLDDGVAEKVPANIKLLSLAQLEALGTLHPAPRANVQPSDLACIMYTSGSTGTPKGVELTHANMIASVAGLSILVEHLVDETDVYLAYLPLAHILELMIECYAIYKGVPLGYGSPKTLTDASMRNCKGDIKTLRPTVLTGVPAVWDSIKKGVETKIRAMPRAVQAAFNAAQKLKQMQILRGSSYSFVPDSLIFNKVRQETGGRLKIAVSGGAPLSPDTQLFVASVLCDIVVGYGCTESTGLSAARTPEFGFATKNTGAPMPSFELKLVDVPEAGYLAKNNQGEVWLRSPAVMRGYYKQPEMTAEVLTPDGWYRTGDIGQLQPDGTLSIIDRAKNITKLSNGEYIALEKLESVYAACHYLARVCVYADSDRNCAIAIGNPNPPMIKQLAASLGLNTDAMSMHEICEHRDVKAGVVRDLAKIAKSNGFVSAEYLKAVILDDEEWTPQSGLLTAAMKLQRRSIVKKHQQQIDATYASL